MWSLVSLPVLSSKIKAVTLQMKVPEKTQEQGLTRQLLITNETHQVLLESEAYLRKLAYKTTTIKTDASFFDDSDMVSDYFLIVVFETKTKTPLLSARYYYHRETISNALKGEMQLEKPQINFSTDDYANNELFLSDRLSGNISNSSYRCYRDFIFLLFYSEILNHNRHNNLLLMARSELKEKLVAKYLRLGFEKIGFTHHKGKKHWIVFTNLQKGYAKAQLPLGARMFIAFRYLVFKFKGHDSSKN